MLLEKQLLMQAGRLNTGDVRKQIAQARAIAEFRRLKDKHAVAHQQQQIVDLLGLQRANKGTKPAKKKSPAPISAQARARNECS